MIFFLKKKALIYFSNLWLPVFFICFLFYFWMASHNRAEISLELMNLPPPPECQEGCTTKACCIFIWWFWHLSCVWRTGICLYFHKVFKRLHVNITAEIGRLFSNLKAVSGRSYEYLRCWKDLYTISLPGDCNKS